MLTCSHARWGIFLSCVLLATLGTLGACSPETTDEQTGPAEPLPIDLSVDLEVRSLDGTQVFTVPHPGDPEWEDFMEMLDHPQFKSRLQGRKGYTKVYDPEWRAAVRGYRDAPQSDIELVSAFDKIEDAAREVLAGIEMNDFQYMQLIRIDETEFRDLVWPCTPQSRPVLRIDWQESWGGHVGHCIGGARKLLDDMGGREWVLESMERGKPVDYGQFRIIPDIVLHVVDANDQSKATIKGLSSIIERNGRFKAYMYKD